MAFRRQNDGLWMLRNDSILYWHTEEDMLERCGRSGYMFFYVRSDLIK